MIVKQKAILRLCSVSLRAAAFLSASRLARVHPATLGLHEHSGGVNRRETEHWYGVSSMLVCGDGDLSYSAWLSSQLAAAGVTLTATVLEDEETHHNVYKNSRQHLERISSFGHEVRFGIDATQLSTCFPNATFDRIQFNFPHWKGKANNRYNRQLLSSFLDSASQILHPSGAIHVALCEGQGGATASTVQQWKQSWTAALYAAESGLLLQEVVPYEPVYDLSSHRGVDRPFRIGGSPELYKFAFPKNMRVDKSLQLCCRHELHIALPVNDGVFTMEGLLNGDQVLDFCRGLVPGSIGVEVPIRKVLSPPNGPEMIVFLICYCGEQVQLTRIVADSYRDILETEISKHLTLRENRRGRLVSRPFPYPLLQQLIDEHI